MNFNPTRLTFAREARGLTKRKLANLTNLSDKSISTYEADKNIPTAFNLEVISKALNFPIAFFYGDDIEKVPEKAVFFRAISKLSSYKKNQCLSEGAMAIMVSNWLESKFKLPKLDLPCFSDKIDNPEIIADNLRIHWNLELEPIENLLHLVEAKGIKVFSLSGTDKDVDAYSFWYNNKTPFIFLNYSKSAERCRFDIAHELGHLIMHKTDLDDVDNKNQEKEANSFASCFLMPTQRMYSYASSITPDKMMLYKKKWGVSLLAFTYRLHKLNLISDWASRTIYIKYGRLIEPNGMKHEISEIIPQILNLLKENGNSIKTIAKDLNLLPETISTYLFKIPNKGLVLIK